MDITSLSGPSTNDPRATPAISVDGLGHVLPVLPNQMRAGRRFASAAALSLALHAAIVALAVAHWGPTLRGGGGQQLGAMIIEIVDATAVDSVVTAAEAGTTGAGALAQIEGQSPTLPTPAANAAAQPVAKSAADGLPPVEGPAPDAMATSKPDHAPQERTTEDAVTETVRGEPARGAAPPNMTAPPVIAGGSTSVAMAETSAQPSAAAASPGDIERYRNDVRQALGRQPPRRGLAHGALKQSRGRTATVVIGFGVSDQGDVENAQLLEPSLNPELNALLLTWINAAALPPPPVGLSAADRRFSLPLTIR